MRQGDSACCDSRPRNDSSRSSTIGHAGQEAPQIAGARVVLTESPVDLPPRQASSRPELLRQEGIEIFDDPLLRPPRGSAPTRQQISLHALDAPGGPVFMG